MKLYKSPKTGLIHAYEEDGSQDHVIPSDFISVTEEEADIIRQENGKKFIDSLPYTEKRKNNYPPLTDLADALYWQSKGDSSKMKQYLEAVENVKTK